MYKYETHLHTWPVSQCGNMHIKDHMIHYKEHGYDGIFVTNHFLDGNLNLEKRALPYEEKIEFFFSDYEEGKKYEEEIGIKVFCGAEISYKGTDFLIYGLDKKWFLEHSEIMDMKKSEELKFLMENGALVIQAHPFSGASYIDHIRLFPKCTMGVEVLNAHKSDLENKMAEIYAENYGLLKTAGSDNHDWAEQLQYCKRLAGMECETPLVDEQDFINRVKRGEMKIFTTNL